MMNMNEEQKSRDDLAGLITMMRSHRGPPVECELVVVHHVRVASFEPALHGWIRLLAESLVEAGLRGTVCLCADGNVLPTFDSSYQDLDRLDAVIMFQHDEGATIATYVISRWWSCVESSLDVPGRSNINMTVSTSTCFSDVNVTPIPKPLTVKT